MSSLHSFFLQWARTSAWEVANKMKQVDQGKLSEKMKCI